MNPVESLKHQRHGAATAATENERANRYAFGVVRLRVEHRIVLHGSGETAVRMSRLLLRSGCPFIALPVQAFPGDRTVLAFPPDIAIRKQRDIGIDCVA